MGFSHLPYILRVAMRLLLVEKGCETYDRTFPPDLLLLHLKICQEEIQGLFIVVQPFDVSKI